MNFVLLADEPAAATTVARWYFDEWGAESPGVTIEKVIKQVSLASSRETAPLIVLAKKEGKVIGAAELKIREMKIYPDYEYWIGGVYIHSEERGLGVGSLLVRNVLGRAAAAGIRTLYLQTMDLTGGIYARLGFQPVEQVNYAGTDVLVMSRSFSDSASCGVS